MGYFVLSVFRPLCITMKHNLAFSLATFFFSHVVPVLSLMAVFILRRLVIRDHLTEAYDHSLAVLS